MIDKDFTDDDRAASLRSADNARGWLALAKAERRSATILLGAVLRACVAASLAAVPVLERAHQHPLEAWVDQAGPVPLPGPGARLGLRRVNVGFGFQLQPPGASGRAMINACFVLDHALADFVVAMARAPGDAPDAVALADASSRLTVVLDTAADALRAISAAEVVDAAAAFGADVCTQQWLLSIWASIGLGSHATLRHGKRAAG